MVRCLVRTILCLILTLLWGVPAFAAQASLTWVDNSTNETNFLVERKLGAGSFAQVASLGANVQSWVDTGVTNGSTYSWRVRASNAAGQSAYSNTATLLVQAQNAGPSTVTCVYSDTVPPPSGLVAAYAMNSGGSTVLDASGNGNTGTVSGATWTTAGKYGDALLFDGINDWITVADVISLDLTTTMTLEAWVYPTKVHSNWAAILMKEQPGGFAYALYVTSGNQAAGYIRTSEGVQGGNLPVNTWSHITTTYDGALIRVYVNGVQVASIAKTGSVGVTTGPLRIGGNSIWNTEFFQGRIDAVRIYNRALSGTEIQADMNAPL